MKITKIRFMNYEKVRRSGKRNMFGYDRLIQTGDNYEKAHKHFITDKLEDDFETEGD